MGEKTEVQVAAQDTSKPAKKSPVEKINEVVEAWFSDQINNSPIARETQAYNHAVVAKEALKQKLLELF